MLKNRGRGGFRGQVRSRGNDRDTIREGSTPGVVRSEPIPTSSASRAPVVNLKQVSEHAPAASRAPVVNLKQVSEHAPAAGAYSSNALITKSTPAHISHIQPQAPAPAPSNSAISFSIPVASAETSSSGNDNRVLICPNGKEFTPYDTSKTISTIIKSKYEKPWTGWNQIPKNVRMLWFGEFKGLFRWDPKHDHAIKKIWKNKCATYVRQSLSDIRRGKSVGAWLPGNVLKALKETWASDPIFLHKSEQNKKNIAANQDGYLNRGGAISTSERRRRYGKELGRSVSIPEVFLKVNYDEKTGKWFTPEAQKRYDAYEKLKALKVSQGIKNIDDSTCFYEANGGCNKKGLAYGFGSEVPFYSSTCSGSCVTDAQKRNDRMSALEQQNVQLESELSSLRSLVEKLHKTNPDASASTVPATNHDDDCRTEEEFGDDYDI